MRDYNSSTFVDASGQQYQLLMSFTPARGQTVMLDIAQLKQLDYQTSLNDLVTRGSFVYADHGGMLDNSLYEPGGLLKVVFSRMDTEFDGDLAIVSEFEGGELNADFLVESAGILERQNEVITYRMQFTSVNTVDCLKTLDYSNYGKGPEPVLDILKNLAVAAGVAVDEETFGSVKQQPRISYITNGNDNLFTASKFLLDKLYYRFPRAGSMSFVFWNELTKKLQLFDAAGRKSATGQTGIAISMFAAQAEAMAGGVQNELGTVTKFPTSAALGMGYKRQVASYDYSRNKFEYDNIKPEQVFQYMNERFIDGENITGRYHNVFLKQPDMYTVRGSYWNNDFHFYKTFVDAFFGSGALMVKTIGNITRLPGSVVGITVDRGQEDMMEENPDVYEDILRRYKGLEGAWIVAKAHHYIQPNVDKADRYRQTLTLVRNFNYPAE